MCLKPAQPTLGPANGSLGLEHPGSSCVVTGPPSGGAADANVFNERGLRCLNITHGVYDFHSPNERVAVADLEAMVDLTVALVEDARA